MQLSHYLTWHMIAALLNNNKKNKVQMGLFVWELAKQYETQSLPTMGSILGRFSVAAHVMLAKQILCGFREPRRCKSGDWFPPGTAPRLCSFGLGF